VPDFSTICRRQRTLAVNIPYRGAKGPLHLLIDSNGIKDEGEWKCLKKYFILVVGGYIINSEWIWCLVYLEVGRASG
jgi:hypothetical protein